MKSFFNVTLILLVICTNLTTQLLAQSEIASTMSTSWVGVIAGYNESKGLQPSFYAGLTYEMLLGEEVENRKSSIIFRGMFESMPVFIVVPGADYPSRLPNGSEFVSTTQHTTNIKYNLATIEALYKLNLFGSKFGFTVGPSFGIPISSSIEKRFQLLEPKGVQLDVDPTIPSERYLDSNRTIITSPEGPIDELNPFRFAIKFGVHYELVVARAIIVPHIWYNYGLTTASTTDGVRINALQAGVEIRFAL